jgi:hypothetical protein
VIVMSDSISERTSAEAGRSIEAWDILLEQYRHTAVETLARHLRTGTRCRACDQPWPCLAACAAEATLEL